MTDSLIFASGIGRYRVVVVFAVYYALKALYALLKNEQKIILLLVPATVIALYFDIAKGPIFPLFAKNYLLIALPVMLTVDNLAVNFVKKMICNISEGQFFVACPACKCFHKDLVEKCQNCFYKKGNQLTVAAAKISPMIRGDRIPPGLLKLLNLGTSEEILLHKKLTRNFAKFKNGVRQARKHFVITTENLIILDYYSFHIRIPNSWREKDIIALSDIISIEGTMKKYYMAMRPFLIIRTVHGDVFEIVFSTFENYSDQIKDISDIIKKANSHVNVILNLKPKRTIISQFAAVEGLDIKKMRRLLLLVALLLILLAIVLWRFFQSIDAIRNQ